MSHSFATGNVSGTATYTWVGGLVGINLGGTVSHSFATGSVSGTATYTYVGGLVGDNRGTVQNSYATGTVTRKSGSTSTDFGGFVGRNLRGNIINCYSTGSVHYEDAEDPTNKGFAGSVDTRGDYNMSGNFWDVETSGQNETAGDTTGLNTVEMRTRSTYIDTGWDFDEVWEIDQYRNDGYPYLQWQEFEDGDEIRRPIFFLVAVVLVIFIALILFMVAASGKSDKLDQN